MINTQEMATYITQHTGFPISFILKHTDEQITDTYEMVKQMIDAGFANE